MEKASHQLLPIHRDGITRPAALVFVAATPEPALAALAERALHPNELAYWRQVTHPARRADFLLGRLAAKTALGLCEAQPRERELEIAFGAFGQPLARTRDHSHEVSIAHSSSGALAIAFAAGEALAIDREEVSFDPQRVKSLQRQMTDRERALIAPLPEALGLTVLWVAKEALSKALRCGISTPFPLLEADRIRLADGGAEITFRNFGQYRALVRHSERLAQALLLPIDSQLDLTAVPLFE